MAENLGRCDKKQYEHRGPHPQYRDVGQRLPPFGCVNWKPEPQDMAENEGPEKKAAPDHLRNVLRGATEAFHATHENVFGNDLQTCGHGFCKQWRGLLSGSQAELAAPDAPIDVADAARSAAKEIAEQTIDILRQAYPNIKWPTGTISGIAFDSIVKHFPADAVRQARRETAWLHQRMNEHEHVGLADGIFGGATPVVSGIRISVHDILTYLYNGNSIQYIAETYGLTPEAIKDAIAFAQDVYDEAAAALRAEGEKGEGDG